MTMGDDDQAEDDELVSADEDGGAEELTEQELADIAEDEAASSSSSDDEPVSGNEDDIDDDALLGLDLDALVAGAQAAGGPAAPAAAGAGAGGGAAAPRAPRRTVSVANEDFLAKNLVALHFDCEHTGFHVCQISAEAYNMNTLEWVGEPVNLYIKPPEHRWNPMVTQVHGLSATHSKIRDAPPLSEQWPKFVAWWESTIGVGTAAGADTSEATKPTTTPNDIMQLGEG